LHLNILSDTLIEFICKVKAKESIDHMHKFPSHLYSCVQFTFIILVSVIFTLVLVKLMTGSNDDNTPQGATGKT